MKRLVVIALAVVMFACREDKYQLRTNVRTAPDGRSYLTMEIFLGRERVEHYADIEMVPDTAVGFGGRRNQGPLARVHAIFDADCRGAVVTMHVRKGTDVLAHETQFVERPAPAGYRRLGPADGIRSPMVIDRVQPLFPEKARRNQRHGTVFVEARVNTRGAVDSVVVLNPSPKWDGLDQAAAEAVRQWRFKPANLEGLGIPVAIVEKVNFRLR